MLRLVLCPFFTFSFIFTYCFTVDILKDGQVDKMLRMSRVDRPCDTAAISQGGRTEHVRSECGTLKLLLM